MDSPELKGSRFLGRVNFSPVWNGWDRVVLEKAWTAVRPQVYQEEAEAWGWKGHGVGADHGFWCWPHRTH